MRKDVGKIFICVVGGVGLCALAMGSPRVLAASSPSPATFAASGRSSPTIARSKTARGPSVFDVVLQSNGVVYGRMVAPDGQPATSCKVVMRNRDGGAVETISDAQGQFALSNLAPGVYELQVQTPWGTARHVCRVWSACGAPPLATSELAISLGGATIRGQIPFAPTSFPQFATVSALIGGAVAAPVIYSNAQTDNWVPSSP